METGEMNISEAHAERYFRWVTARRWPVLILGLLLIVLAGMQLPKLVKDTSADAFINPTDPALVYRDRVEEVFGLRDPIVIAVINKGGTGIFNPHSLALVSWLTERVAGLPNVDPERVTSLATEKDIVGTADGMMVEEFFEENPQLFRAPLGTQARADEIHAAIQDFPLYRGSLVSRDGTATIIVAELLDDTKAQETYDRMLALADEAPKGNGDEIHVAGEGAVAGYLATYIDRDARRLNPLAALVITVILGIAFMSMRGMLLPNLVVA
ncbi:MAG: outer membrane lipoprotein-sorting protein, partial [Alphaproteobacteria bacterium]